jgi:hypothetical protein
MNTALGVVSLSHTSTLRGTDLGQERLEEHHTPVEESLRLHMHGARALQECLPQDLGLWGNVGNGMDRCRQYM